MAQCLGDQRCDVGHLGFLHSLRGDGRSADAHAGGDEGAARVVGHRVLVQRDDDKKEVVQERLSHYPGYRDALLSFYQSVGQTVEAFDVDALSSEIVYERFVDLAETIAS